MNHASIQIKYYHQAQTFWATVQIIIVRIIQLYSCNHNPIS